MSTKIDSPAEEVQKIQDSVLENIGVGECQAVNLDDSLLSCLSSYDDKVIDLAMGELGRGLRQFAMKVDLEHPLVNDLSEGTLLKSGALYNRALEAFEVAKMENASQFAGVLGILQEWFNRNHKEISKKLIKVPPRIIKSEIERTRERLKKSKKVLDISKLLQKGEDGFFKYSPTFKRYVRNSEVYRAEISQNDRIAKRFEALGLVGQARVIDDANKEIRDSVSDKYFGFMRLNMKDAALMLARMIGCKFESGVNQILVSKRMFGQEHFWDTKPSESVPLEFEHDFDEVSKRKPTEQELPFFGYSPRAYPLPKFNAIMPENVKKIIGKLEAHPCANNKPIFDHFWVIVPGINYPASDGCWTFRLGDEVYREYDEWECFTKLDTYLTNKGLICPIILAENVIEKKCYFISYWK